MEEVECLSNQTDIFLPQLSNTNLILVISTVGKSTEGKPDIISNKRKLMQKYYKEEMIEDLDKNASEKTTRLPELLAYI